jgi:hypothetical protein
LRCRISNIRGIGIRVHRLNKTKIKGCEIQRCITGIELLSADPYVIFNNIHNIWENGILVIAKNGLRCDGLIKMNRIYQCRDNGILCAGLNNHVKIEKNSEIASNRLAGIKVSENASVTIFAN